MLSPKAQKIMEQYFNLPFYGFDNVRCPYFNNARAKQRAQLRVLIGKGAPEEIVEEAKIISMQYHCGLFDKSGNCCLHGEKHENKACVEEIRKFLVNHNLGIECSGFVTQILRAHFKEKYNIDIVSKFYKVPISKFFRWIISFLRPIENISVRTYANDKNTKRIKWQDMEAGDVLVVLGAGQQEKKNHILLIVEKADGVIKYAHARAWNKEGKYGHGVAFGEIKITNTEKSLLEQQWIEKDCFGENNETFVEARGAILCEARRILV
jgi:hypothetical protein